jgi:hypothetical protein
MADGNVVENEVVETTETTQVQTPEIPQEVREMMEISLNGGIAPKQEQVQTEVETQTQETVIEPTPFQFEVFKEKFGYETPDQVLQEIEELRNLKANPPKAEPQYANEESKLIAQALSEGKQEEVYNYLNRKMELEKVLSQEVTEDNADSIIKMSMKAKYSSLNDEQIQHKFNRQYSIPKEPIQGLSEDDEDFQERHNEWKETVGQVKMDKVIDAKMALPTLEELKKEIVLPKIESVVDEDYLTWQKSLESLEEQDTLTKEAYKNLQPKDVETKVKFIDEANKINFEFQFQPDGEGFKKAVEVASDMDKFFKSFFDSEGKPNREMFVDAIYYAMNKQKVINEAIKQGSNARMKALLPDNNDGGLQRQNPQELEENSLDMLMKNSLRVGGVKI